MIQYLYFLFRISHLVISNIYGCLFRPGKQTTVFRLLKLLGYFVEKPQIIFFYKKILRIDFCVYLCSVLIN